MTCCSTSNSVCCGAYCLALPAGNHLCTFCLHHNPTAWSHIMAWGRGTASGIDDLIKRLIDQDEKLQSLTVLRFRRLNDSDVEALAKALHDNSILQELNCSSHSLTADASAALGTMLRHNRGLKRISIGNSSWGDQVNICCAVSLKRCQNTDECSSFVTQAAATAAGTAARSSGRHLDVSSSLLQPAFLTKSLSFWQGLSALAAGLKHNSLLEAWDLEHKVCCSCL